MTHKGLRQRYLVQFENAETIKYYVFYYYSFPLEGKQQAYYSIPTLVGLLEDADKFVRSQSAGALMR